MTFEEFWPEARRIWSIAGSPTGTRSEAKTEFEKLKLTAQDAEDILTAALTQATAKKEARECGQNPANFKHVCRYLKHKAWEIRPDEIYRPSVKLSRCEQELQRIAQRRAELAGTR